MVPVRHQAGQHSSSFLQLPIDRWCPLEGRLQAVEYCCVASEFPWRTANSMHAACCCMASHCWRAQAPRRPPRPVCAARCIFVRLDVARCGWSKARLQAAAEAVTCQSATVMEYLCQCKAARAQHAWPRSSPACQVLAAQLVQTACCIDACSPRFSTKPLCEWR